MTLRQTTLLLLLTALTALHATVRHAAPTGTDQQVANTWNSGVPLDAADFESLDVARYILAPRRADGSLPDTPLLRRK